MVNREIQYTGKFDMLTYYFGTNSVVVLSPDCIVSLVTVLYYYLQTRDEAIWRYIDTVSIRRLTIRIVAQRDISRYDLDICNQGKSPRCL